MWRHVTNCLSKYFSGFDQVLLCRCNIPTEDLTRLLEASRPAPRLVSLQECRNVRGAFVDRILPSTKLEQLFLAKTGSLAATDSPRITEPTLRCAGLMRVTDDLSMPLSSQQLTEAEYLALPNSQLSGRSAGGWGILTAIQHMPKLKYLFLGGCQIGLFATELRDTLAMAPSLQVVEVSFVRVWRDPKRRVAAEGARGRWEPLAEHDDIMSELRARYELLEFNKLVPVERALALAERNPYLRNTMRFAANCQDQWGRTPLSLACQGLEYQPQSLTDRGRGRGRGVVLGGPPRPNIRGIDVRGPAETQTGPGGVGLLPVDEAHRADYTKLAQLLISEVQSDVTIPDHRGASPLYRACERDAAECARLLLNAGAPFHVGHVQRRERPLFIAALRGCQRTVDVLLSAVPEGCFESFINAEGLYYHGYTPVHAAAVGGHLEILRTLLEAGLHPARQNRYGQTPLIITAHQKRIECARLLISYMSKANLALADEYGVTALGVTISAPCDKEFQNLLRGAGVPQGRIPKKKRKRRGR